MSTALPPLPPLAPLAPLPRLPRQPSTALRAARRVRAALRALVALLDRLRLLLARLVAWFAADPRRFRAALAGLVASAATGALLGLGVGFAADATITFLLGLVAGP